MTLTRTALAAVAGILLLVPAAPSATRSVREQVDAIELDIRDLQQKVLEMQEVQASIQKSLADLREALALDSPGRRSPADLAARLDSVETDLRVMQENQNDSRHRVSVLSDKVDTVYRRQAQLEDAAAAARAAAAADAAPAGEGEGAEPRPAPEPPAVDEEEVGTRPDGAGARADRGPGAEPAPDDEPLVDPEELYQSARADFGRGSYDLALSGFEDFLRRFPDSELADNAQYWVGESHYASRRLPEAIEAFEVVAERHPDADKAPDAAYKRGLALLELNRTAEGIIQLQKVKDTWPGSPAGRLARAKLQSMGLL